MTSRGAHGRAVGGPIRRSTALVIVAALTLLPTPASTAYADEGEVIFRINSERVTESSSLVVSTAYDALAYTTNDSGDDAVVYVLDTADGDLAGTTTMTGVDAVDIEALAGGADGSLVVADIGDNSAERASVQLYRIDQPGRGDRTVTPDALTLRYADGPRDAESVLYDSDTGRVFVVSKEFGDAHVYRSDADVFDRGSSMLRRVAAAPPLATDATYLPGGRHVVVRGYLDATVFRAAGWRRLATFDLPPQEQGESIAAPASGDVVWVGTEGNRSPVMSVPLPELPAPGGPSPSAGSGSDPPGTPGSATEDGATEGATGDDEVGVLRAEDARAMALWVAGAALAGLLLVLVLLVVRSRRSRVE